MRNGKSQQGLNLDLGGSTFNQDAGDLMSPQIFPVRVLATLESAEEQFLTRQQALEETFGSFSFKTLPLKMLALVAV